MFSARYSSRMFKLRMQKMATVPLGGEKALKRNRHKSCFFQANAIEIQDNAKLAKDNATPVQVLQTRVSFATFSGRRVSKKGRNRTISKHFSFEAFPSGHSEQDVDIISNHCFRMRFS